MQDIVDAFGQALSDYYEGMEAQIIIERDDGNLDVSAEPELYFLEYEDWDDYERQAIDLVQGRVLDIGCGAGRHSLYLQDLGHRVVALDISPGAIDVAVSRGVRDTALMPVTQVSRKLGSFDSIIMMGNNFGLVANRKRAKWLFRRLFSMTSREARIIATSLDPSTTEDPLHLAYHEKNKKRGRMIGQVRIRVRYRNMIGPWFDYLLVSEREMQKLIEGTGWTVSSIIESEGPTYAALIEKIRISN